MIGFSLTKCYFLLTNILILPLQIFYLISFLYAFSGYDETHGKIIVAQAKLASSTVTQDSVCPPQQADCSQPLVSRY